MSNPQQEMTPTLTDTSSNEVTEGEKRNELNKFPTLFSIIAASRFDSSY